jgi:hypothetical protein
MFGKGGKRERWRWYNKVKHNRNTYFRDANLENCANAISSLFVAVLYCHKAERSREEFDPLPIILGRQPEPSSLSVNAYIIPAFT